MAEKLTLQINSLAALERLIGGDSEIEIDIRNSVVARFVAKNIRPLAVDAANTSIRETVKQEVEPYRKEIALQIKAYFAKSSEGAGYPLYREWVTVSPEHKAALALLVKEVIDNELHEQLAETVAKAKQEIEERKNLFLSGFDAYLIAQEATLDNMANELANRQIAKMWEQANKQQ